MSEPAALGAIKQDPEDVSTKTDEATFTTLTEEGFPVGPSLKSPTPAEDTTTILSDDETKTLTTLEPARKPSGGVAKKSFPGAAGATAVSQKLSNEPPKNDLSTPVKSKTSSSATEQPSADSLIQKMRSKLSKHIELKSINPAKPAKPASPAPLDMSGAIEIPQDMILSNDIPQTPIAASDAKESRLDDHDLIAILEGNMVEIRENASEIEVCDVGASLEIVSFSIIDPDQLQQEKKEREMEIARRQMESLPLLPKVRKPRTKTVPKRSPTVSPAASQGVPVEANVTPPPPVVKEPVGVTIKGQTTIRPVVKIPSGAIKKEETAPLETAETIKVRISKNLKEKLMKEMKLPVQTVEKPLSKVEPVTVSPQTKSELVDSLVSDWDDDPPVQQQDGVDDPQETEKKPVLAPSNDEAKVPQQQQQPKSQPTQFVAPPPIAEPKRVIKRKIIWDPSDASIPFASLVKSNRAQSAGTTNTELSPLRRKRADSVAVRMIDNAPHFSTVAPVRPRAKTPDLGQAIERSALAAKPDELANEAKAKKRKKNEIERLLGDEGAINMLYDVECEATRKDLLKETEVDTSDEDEKLLAKTKIITDAVINQGKSPNESPTSQGLRVRAKRGTTPSNQSGSTATSPGSAGTAQQTSKASVPSATSSASGAGGNQPSKKPANGKATTTTTIPAITGARKRKMTASAAKEWEYVYNAPRSDDAMIIRRRSNSSYSSGGASPRRLSFDQPNESGSGFGFGSESSTLSQNGTNNNKSSSPGQQQQDAFLKPPNKKEPKLPVTKPPGGAGGSTGSEDIKFNPSLVANMRGKLSKVLKGMKGAPLATSTPGQDVPAQANKQAAKRKAPASSVDVVDSAVSAAGSDVASPPGGGGSFQDAAVEKQLDQLKQMTCVKQGNYAEIVMKSRSVTSGDGSKGPLENVFSQEVAYESVPIL
ncbi:AGAP007022-PA [Anopheles gambiae str. PEST]|uniref:AGAP007022-PA n=1 Tax=Anopheles gambiae TaxID=7165 RepID=A7URS7_ANOGA|nr:AGAP007022-PA [Anopheles gambiae str. PEST]